jgi:glycosyltransferase involved in cell wall biosynthesis
MKILFTNSIGKNKWGGGEKWMILTAKGLQEKGYEVSIGCLPFSILEKKSSENNIPVVRLDIRSDLSFAGAFQLRKYINENKPDVVIATQNRDVLFAGLAVDKRYPTAIIARHGVQLIKKNIKHKLIYKNLCDGVIVNTKSIKRVYDSYKWWGNDFVKVIYNGIDIAYKSKEKFDLKDYIPDFNNKFKIIISIGRLSNQKGFKYLIDAAVDILKAHPNSYFLIVGQGKEKRSLFKRVQRLNLQDRVFILPFQDNVYKLLNVADLFVLPSLYEGMPNVVMEALSCRVPVICTKVNGAEELFGDENSTCLVPPADKSVLRDAILRFLDNGKPEYDVDEVYERVKTNYSLNGMVDNIDAYIKKIEK